MAVAEAFVLLFIGLVVGIVTTVFDVLVVGSASFITHFSLWVLLNALLASHVESRAKATWWAVPFNLGYVESYYITTSATYEGFARSLVVPLAGMAVIAPLLTFALWTAKNQKNVFGRLLSLVVIGGTLGASYLINATVSAFDIVVCVLLALLLLVVPTRKLKITRVTRSSERARLDAEKQAAELAATDAPKRKGDVPPARQTIESAPRRRMPGRPSARTAAERDVVRRQPSGEAPASAAGEGGTRGTRRSLRPTKRKGGARSTTTTTSVTRSSVRKRRAAEAAEAQEREARRRAASERRSRQDEGGVRLSGSEPLPTLGTARTARRSTR